MTMRRIFGRLTAVLLVLILLIGGAVWGLLRYIAPQETLDLSYTPIDVRGKVVDMVRRMEPELVITEADINNLFKMELSKGGSVDGGDGFTSNPDIRIDGARFTLEDDVLTAYINVTYKDRVPVGAIVVYRLLWEEPNIVMEPESVAVREIKLPATLVDRKTIPIEASGSNLVTVKDVVFDQDRVKIAFGVNSPF